MGLLDNLENQAMGKVLGGNSNPLAAGLLQMIQNQPGGLPGLVQSFQEKGFGGLVSSWVSTGPNPPISADQIHQVLGSDQVKALAAKAGISPAIAGSAIAELLPGIVDKLTPNGSVPDHSHVLEMASSMLKNFETKLPELPRRLVVSRAPFLLSCFRPGLLTGTSGTSGPLPWPAM